MDIICSMPKACLFELELEMTKFRANLELKRGLNFLKQSLLKKS